MPWRTTDGGASWTQAGAAFTTGDFPATAIAVAPTDPNYVLMGRSSGFVRRTTTALTNTSSTNWPQILPPPAQAYNSWLAFDPLNKNTAYATYSSFGVPHVWKSTDAGATWASIDGSGATGIPDIPVHSIVINPADTSRLYVGTDLGVFASTDGGGSWLVENSGFANVVTESLAVNGTNLFAFTHGRGAFRVPLTPGPPTSLALAQSRVSVTVDWQSQYSGQSGRAFAIPQQDGFAFFYFSDPGNPEVFVKVLDFGQGAALCFVGGLSDFFYQVTFTTLRTGQALVFTKPAFQYLGFGDNSTLKF